MKTSAKFLRTIDCGGKATGGESRIAGNHYLTGKAFLSSAQGITNDGTYYYCTGAFVLSALLGFPLENTLFYRIPVVAQLTAGQFTAQYFSGLWLHAYVWPIFSRDLVGYPVTLGLLLLAFWLGYRLKSR